MSKGGVPEVPHSQFMNADRDAAQDETALPIVPISSRIATRSTDRPLQSGS
jgi:hypothetical protein